MSSTRMTGELPLAVSGEFAAQPGGGTGVQWHPAEWTGERLREVAANSLIVAILSPFLALGSRIVPRILLAVVILDIPLQFGKHLYYREEDAALGALGGLSISATTIALAGLYASRIITALARRNKEARYPLEINLPLALFVAFSALSLFAAQDVGLSFFEVFLNLQMYLLFFYVANFVRSRQEVLYVVSLLLFSVILESGIIIILSFTGMPTTLWGIPAHIYMDPGSQQGFMRIGGTLGSPNQTAGFLSLLLVPAVGVLFTRLGGTYKWLARAALGLGAVALIFTYSRGGWIAFAIALTLLCGLFWRRRRVSLKAPIVIVVALALVYLPFHSAVSTRLFGDDRGSAESRIPLMKLAYRMIEDNPVLGVGSNNFQLVMYHYLTSDFRMGFRYAVHNKYLLVLAETGILGFLAYLVFLLGILRTAWRCWKLSDPVFSPLALGFMAAFAGHMVHMSVEVFRGRPITQLVWLLAGLLTAMYRLCAPVHAFGKVEK
jgi:putative inorganic carbon (HCO3(-)) transporter